MKKIYRFGGNCGE